jgi:hypothetical protein
MNWKQKREKAAKRAKISGCLLSAGSAIDRGLQYWKQKRGYEP